MTNLRLVVILNLAHYVFIQLAGYIIVKVKYNQIPSKGLHMDTNNRKNKTKKWILFGFLGLLLVAGSLLTACRGETPTPVVPPPTNTSAPTPVPITVDVNKLYENLWTLVGYGDPDNPTVIEEGTSLTLQFTTMDGHDIPLQHPNGSFRQPRMDNDHGPLATTCTARAGNGPGTAYLITAGSVCLTK
jgi:hypothetical protein